MYKLKITCYTPPGKARGCSKSFKHVHFGALKKPVDTKIISDTEFYYTYEYEKEKQMNKVINKSIPKAEIKIRQYYMTLIHIIKKANKLGKKGAWTLEKTKNWIKRRFTKQGGDPKDLDDFIDAISLEDEEYMMEFLKGDLFKYEVL